MLTVTTIVGNIKNNLDLKQRYEESLKKNTLETITIQRSETEKVRMRKVSDKETDVGFILPSRTHLRDGDVVFLDDAKMIIIKLSPELVAILNIKKNIHPHSGDGDSSSDIYHNHNHNHNHNHDFTNVAIKVGHTIGNLHRPLKIDKDDIIFPIQTPDEINLFLRLLSDLKDYVEIRTETLIFEPDQGFDIHAH
jgi:urease accessory protein